ncbi:YbaY family lipoprotein [Dyella sedimenti]|uniref:YbaY family lipoprotein n=1 Tax=Dyella sedimenti TaxID=2919947 RepID=UPI001FAA9F70|nr:YbaY family lipoprotein [Dyella sedimenti]
MLSRSMLLAAIVALAGCSMFSRHARHEAPASMPAQPAAPVHQALMKSIIGDVRYELPQPVPADAYLLVTLADVSRLDAAARTVAVEKIQPVGASPVDFLLGYDPGELRDGVDFAISVRLLQGDKLLAVSETSAHVLGRSGGNGPVSLTLQPVP